MGDIELEAVALLMASGVQLGARRVTDRRGHVVVDQRHAFGRERPAMRGSHNLAAIGAGVAPAEVVRHHGHHIRGLGGRVVYCSLPVAREQNQND